MEKFSVHKAIPQEVNILLAVSLQGIALRGWKNVLPQRSDEDIRFRFNPSDEARLSKTLDIYRGFARREVGGLFLAYSTDTDDNEEPVGFALSREDVSGNPFQRGYKRLVQPQRVYANLQHVAVDADYQRQGVGSALLAHGLEDFRPDQVPTAYVLAENEIAVEAFNKWGFRPAPADQQPKMIDEYFGAGEPVEQWRYAAGSTEAVIEAVESDY